MTPDAALARLDWFGSADAIARHLADLGCTGPRSAGRECPVARYVMAETGQRIYIDPATWYTVAPLGAELETPENVDAFIVAHDTGRYSFLDEAAA